MTVLLELKDEGHSNLSIDARNGGSGKYVALTYSEAAYLMGRNMIEPCGNCNCYHRTYRTTWEVVEKALNEPDIPNVEPKAPKNSNAWVTPTFDGKPPKIARRRNG